MGICSPLDIVSVGMILWIRTLEMLCSSTGDVGEWCLRHARVILYLVNKHWTEGRGLLTPSLGWPLPASVVVMHTLSNEKR